MIFVNQLFTPCFCKLKFLIKRTKNGCLWAQSLFQITVKIPSGYSSRKSKDHSPQKLRNYVQNFTKQDNTLAEAWLLTRVDSEYSPQESRQGREGSHLYQTSAAIRESLVMVTDQRLRVWKFKYILGSICLFGYIPGWGAIKSMSLKFLASQTPAAKSPKLSIKFLRKSFLSVAKR